MGEGVQADEGESGGLLPAAQGAGPLLQRDYWGVIAGCRLAPPALLALVSERFCELAPEELVVFERQGGRPGGPLAVGDELEVRITGAPTARVRVLHTDARSLTLATLPGHPEAGRITFGAYRNAQGDVLFHIRSRARSGGALMYLGFRSGGEAMQTNTWTDFVNAVALLAGEGVIGFIHTETRELSGEEEEADDVQGPTFRAVGAGGRGAQEAGAHGAGEDGGH
jgi:hypothetical protein